MILKQHRKKDIKLNADKVPVDLLIQAADNVNAHLRNAGKPIDGVDLDLYDIIDLRMLSGLIGEIYANEVSSLHVDLARNPDIDGYPDILDLTGLGLDGNLNSFTKQDFLKFPGGGLEVKNTFGVKKSKSKWSERECRFSHIQNILVWKAHHRQTNNLIALQSNYVDRVPQIVAGFFADDLEECDWTEKQNPKEGSTMTSFCQTTPGAFEKLKRGILFSGPHILPDEYVTIE
ncbi:hypothetical protein [Blastomonas sp. AAP53]|uniref:hypothetical protein n=1 Tax=Blastomonas sp. AAP53 TaxID=1248760 RepID=UPI001266FE69|nr:hypothetical protein [Blastomonas sp. AAP53]